MKPAHVIATSVLAAVLLSTSACSGSSMVSPPTSEPTSSTSTSSMVDDPSADIDSSDNEQDTQEVLDTVNGYYGFIADPTSKDRVRTAAQDLVGRAASDEELQTFATDFYEGFQYFDTSSRKSIQNAYKAMSLGTASVGKEGREISISSEAVTIDGDTATVNTTWVAVTDSGKSYAVAPEADPDPDDLINLMKNSDNLWVIVAKESSIRPSSP